MTNEEMNEYLKQFYAEMPVSIIPEIFKRLIETEARVRVIEHLLPQIASAALHKDIDSIEDQIGEAIKDEIHESITELGGRFGKLKEGGTSSPDDQP